MTYMGTWDDMPDEIRRKAAAGCLLGDKLIAFINGAAELRGLSEGGGRDVAMNAVLNVLGAVLQGYDDPMDTAKFATDVLMANMARNNTEGSA